MSRKFACRVWSLRHLGTGRARITIIDPARGPDGSSHKGATMKIATILLAAALVLPSSFAFAYAGEGDSNYEGHWTAGGGYRSSYASYGHRHHHRHYR
jgi:hypothetical protein